METDGAPEEQDDDRLVGAFTSDPDLRITSVHVEALAQQIHEFLERLLAEGHGFVILTVDAAVAPAENRFVQAGTRTGADLLAECVGAPYTSYRPDEIDVILSLGWFAPDPGERIGNFTSYWEPPLAEEAAALMALTLLKVHQLQRPEDLRIRTGRFNRTDRFN